MIRIVISGPAKSGKTRIVNAIESYLNQNMITYAFEEFCSKADIKKS